MFEIRLENRPVGAGFIPAGNGPSPLRPQQAVAEAEHARHQPGKPAAREVGVVAQPTPTDAFRRDVPYDWCGSALLKPHPEDPLQPGVTLPPLLRLPLPLRVDGVRLRAHLQTHICPAARTVVLAEEGCRRRFRQQPPSLEQFGGLERGLLDRRRGFGWLHQAPLGLGGMQRCNDRDSLRVDREVTRQEAERKPERSSGSRELIDDQHAPAETEEFPKPLQLAARRSEEHTSELQSLAYLVCRLLLEKKKRPLPHES